jgi:hypothetical protein
MRCRVIYASMGYNDHVYRKGEYVEVDTPEEVKRLVGYGAVEKSPVKKEAAKELPRVQAVPEEPATGIIKGVPRPKNKSKSRGKKK